MSAGTRRSEFRVSRVSACINTAFDFLSQESDDEDKLDTIPEGEPCDSNCSKRGTQSDLNGDISCQNNTCRNCCDQTDKSGPCVTNEKTEPADSCRDSYRSENNSVCNSTHVVSSKSVESQDTMNSDGSQPEDLNSFTTVVKISDGDDTRDVKVNMRRESTRHSVASRQVTLTENNSDENTEDDDDDSGVYDAAYRASVWVKVDDADQSWAKESIDIPLPEDDVVFDGMSDDSLLDDRPDRKESTTTTASESEFLRRYQAVSRKVIQRHDSQDTYQKVMTQQFYDADKVVTIEKRDGDADFGFHIAGSCPVFVSTVTPGGAAAVAGVEESDVIVCISGHNVVAATHDEVVALLKKDCNTNTLTLELTPGTKNDINHFKDRAQPVMMGYLLKRGASGIVKTWKRRWCVLKQDNCLYIYKEESDHTPYGAVPLKNYTITKDVGKKFAFRVSRYGADTYIFAASSEDERLRWAEAVKVAAKAGGINGMDTWLDISTHNVNIPALSIKNVDCHGFLTKMGGHYKSWKRRYCVLKDACLYYYVDSIASKAKGLFHLHGYTVLDAPDIKKHGFKLIPANDTLRTFCFYTETDMDKERWMTAMKKSIGKWVIADL